jgi:threonine/homoserine/homoserine lactone efflux protein
MLGTHDLGIFILSSITLNLIPGIDTIYIVSRSLSEGKRAGVISALGISTGSIFHILFAAFGLSALIFSFSYAFSIIKIIGALYLFYLGINMIMKKNDDLHVKVHPHKNKDSFLIYKQAILTNVLNPKVALFFMALLPQFISVDSSSKVLSFLFLGSIFLCTGTLWCIFIAIFSSTIVTRFKKEGRSSAWLSKITGMIFILLGVKLFLQKN